jgi:hypothetical protein
MPVTRIPPGRPAGGQRTPQGEPAPTAAGPGAPVETGEAFLSRFGDVIDDRIAELLDELLDERNATRPRRRLPHILVAVSLALALTASVLLRYSPLAAWTIWPATATICLVITCAARTRQ